MYVLKLNIEKYVHALPISTTVILVHRAGTPYFISVQFVDPIGSSCLLPTSFSGSSWLDSPLISNFRSVAVISEGTVCCGDPFNPNCSWSCLIFARLWRWKRMNNSNRIMRANESTATGVPIAMPRLVELDVGVVVGFGTEASETIEDESDVWLWEIVDEGVTVIIELEAFQRRN